MPITDTTADEPDIHVQIDVSRRNTQNGVMRFSFLLAGLAAALAAVAGIATAHAQPANMGEDSVYDGDYVIIGAGAIRAPSYEGSDDYVLSPIPIILGRIQGIAITPRPGGLAADMIPDSESAKIGFVLGPVATYSFNRNRQVEDPVVRASGKLKASLEMGLNGGITVNRLLQDFDSLTLSADVKWGVNGAHGGMVFSPSLAYLAPLSRATFINVSVSAKYADDDYADYYYGVSPAQNAASGLPPFQAKSGWVRAGVSAILAYDLDGNALNGGPALLVLGSYTRLMDDAKRSPFTSIRGDADQWIGGLGLIYTF